MLERLSISNFVLIKELTLDFAPGFTAITGETGSGKSILLGALGLILGEKANAGLVRQGESEARVEALFSFPGGGEVDRWLKDSGYEGDDDSVYIQRIVRANGRSIASINGISARLPDLEVLGQLLVDVSSQHAHQSLMKKGEQLSLLDGASSSHGKLAEYKRAHAAWREAQAAKASLVEEKDRLEGEMDYIRFCLDEIDRAAPKPGEDERIQAELKIISESEHLTQALEEASAALRGEGGEVGAVTAIDRAVAVLRKVSQVDPSLGEFAERLEAVSIEADDISSSIRSKLSSMSFSEDDLEEKSSRLAVLQRLRKKYGGSLDACLKRREEYRAKVDAQVNFEDRLEELSKEEKKAEAEVVKLGAELSAMRRKGAKALGESVTANLRELGLQSAVFRVGLEETAPGPNGLDDCVFLLSANKGEKEGPLSSVASGGELSRVMLALKSSQAGAGSVGTLLFDEVDAGIGGAVAHAVALKLRELSEKRQVIAITHLAQIASKAGSHLVVSKSEEGGRTKSRIQPISGEDRVAEIARLLSGDAGELSMMHARSLLEV